MAVLRDAGDNAKSDYARRGNKGGQQVRSPSHMTSVFVVDRDLYLSIFDQGKSACVQIVELILERKFLPAIVFSFSKKGMWILREASFSYAIQLRWADNFI